jgi:2-keto-4-pentenoate hydratase/2-oxohepta-3-ene-1,7-dioic acid hydratase in catechol pathway
MKLARAGSAGAETPVLVADDGTLRDLSDHETDFDTDFFASGGVERTRALDPASLPTITATRLGPCIARPGLLMCIGLNYADHARETGASIPDEPILFQKATNTVVGPDDPIIIPKASGNEAAAQTDWEVELGVVVGAGARYLADEAAGWAAIAGYAISNDVSERAFQFEHGGQWTKGKSCESFNPLGPWFVSADEVADPLALAMRTTVNGEVMQDGSTETMIFNPGYLVWYLSQFMVLEPGDLINTGTPPGVGLGMDPPRFLRSGDVVEVSIEGLGTQRQVCRGAV